MSFPDDLPDFLKHSPTPWDPGDKHANLYDANEKAIAHFDTRGVPSKSALDLANRNRTADFVNALADIREPHDFVEIAKMVTKGDLPPEAIQQVMDDAKVFAVRGPGSDGKVDTLHDGVILDPQTLTGARRTAYIVGVHNRTFTIIYIPTGFVVSDLLYPDAVLKTEQSLAQKGIGYRNSTV